MARIEEELYLERQQRARIRALEQRIKELEEKIEKLKEGE
jgi:cell division protein FtsB